MNISSSQNKILVGKIGYILLKYEPKRKKKKKKLGEHTLEGIFKNSEMRTEI